MFLLFQYKIFISVHLFLLEHPKPFQYAAKRVIKTSLRVHYVCDDASDATVTSMGPQWVGVQPTPCTCQTSGTTHTCYIQRFMDDIVIIGSERNELECKGNQHQQNKGDGDRLSQESNLNHTGEHSLM